MTTAEQLVKTVEPNWTRAPVWAQWWAVDYDHSSFWYRNKPEHDAGAWLDPAAEFLFAGDVHLDGIDWTQTLRQRESREMGGMMTPERAQEWRKEFERRRQQKPVGSYGYDEAGEMLALLDALAAVTAERDALAARLAQA